MHAIEIIARHFRSELIANDSAMNNLYVPTHVVRLLTRLANVVSTLSISNHYFFRKSDKTNHSVLTASRSDPEVFSVRKSHHVLGETGWTHWWIRFADLRGSLHEASLTGGVQLFNIDTRLIHPAQPRS